MGHEYSYVRESETLSKGFIFGEDKAALDLAHNGQSCSSELAIYRTQISEMAVCQVFAVSCDDAFCSVCLKDCKLKIISNFLCKEGRRERGRDFQVKVIFFTFFSLHNSIPSAAFYAYHYCHNSPHHLFETAREPGRHSVIITLLAPLRSKNLCVELIFYTL